MAQASERPRRKRLSWESRCEIVWLIERGVSPSSAAARGGASRATGYRLWRRYQESGWAGLRDRRSVPRRQPRRLPVEAEQRILAARRRCAFGPVRLAGLVPHPPSTIGKVLRRHGCSRLPRRRVRQRGALDATSASGRASCCTSIRRSSVASGSRASARSAPRPGGRTATAGSAGSTCMLRSMTTHGSPTPRYSPDRTPSLARASSNAPSAGIASKG
jgi:transposase